MIFRIEIIFVLSAAFILGAKGITIEPSKDDRVSFKQDAAGDYQFLLDENLVNLVLARFSGTNTEPNIPDKCPYKYKWNKAEDGKYDFILTEPLDYEKQQTYKCVIAGMNTYVVLHNVDDNPPKLSPNPCLLDENTDYNIDNTPCKFVIEDADLMYANTTVTILNEDKDVFTFGFKKSDDWEGKTSAIIYMYPNNQLDYEKKTFYDLHVEVKDTANKNEANLIINVDDEPDTPPKFIDFKNLYEIKEEVPNKFTVRAVDGDYKINSPIKYSKVSEKPDYNKVTINETSGEVKIEKIDRDKGEYENNKDSFVLTIRATEEKEPHSTKDIEVTINIQDINDNPPIITKVNGSPPSKDRKFEMSLDENSKTIDFEMEINDIDTIVYAQYNLTILSTKEIDSMPFEILPTLGHNKASFRLSITNSSQLDYEDPDWRVIEFDITTIDQNNDSFSDTLHMTIKLNNLNDEAPLLDNLPAKIDIKETIGNNKDIFQVKSHDPDEIPDDVTIYTLRGANFLTINEDDGKITTNVDNAFDYQKNKKVEVDVIATDQAGNSNQETLTINVLDVNNVPPEIQTYSDTIAIEENQKPDVPLDKVIITARDIDSNCSLNARIDWEKTTFQQKYQNVKKKEEYYFLEVSQNDKNDSHYPCSIEMTFKTNKKANPKEGEGGMPDYEIFDIVNLYLAVNDTETESGNSETSVVVQIHITDVNDEAPHFTIKKLERTIWEGISVGKIETIVAQDKDTNDSVTYTLTPTNEPAKKHKDWIGIDEKSGEIHINEGVEIDCDTDKIYELDYECTATDLKKHSDTIPIKINITDTNNKTPKCNLKDSYSIKENQTNYLLVDIKPTDDDRDPLNHDVQCQFNSLSRTCANFFIIDDKNKIQTNNENIIDYEKDDKEMQCTIKCYDFGSPRLTSDDSTFTVHVEDINDNPPNFESDTHITLFESAINGDALQTLVGSDKDSGVRGDLEFKIINQDKDALFELKKVDSKSTKLTASKDLRGFYGDERKIQLEISDCKECKKEDGVSLKTDVELTILINKHNFDEPEIVFPKEKAVYTLANKQVAGKPMILFNDIKSLDDFQGHNEKGKCTKKWKTAFSFTPDNDFFTFIQHPESCSATLTVTDAYVKQHPQNLKVDMQITYEITDKKIDGDEVKEAPRKKVLQQVTFKFLDAEADPSFNVTETEIEFLEEDKNDEPKEVCRAQYPYENTKLKIYYNLIQDENFFQYNQNDSTISLLEKLDYETEKKHVIKLTASKDGHTTPKEDSIQTITVIVKDINDNPPKFSKSPFIGGLMPGQKTSDPVILDATDVDSVSKELNYSVKDFKKSGKSLDKITEKDFSLNINELKATFEVETSMSGYFTFKAKVTDTEDEYGNGPLSSEADVKIFIITSENLVLMKFQNSLEKVEDEKDCLLHNITATLGCEASKYAFAKDTNSNENITTATLYFVDTENYELLTKSTIMTKLSNLNTFRSLRDELRKCDGLELQSFDSESNKDEDLTAILKAWLIGVTVVLGTLCLILLVIFFLKTRQLKNRISNLTTTKFGSQESGLNRINVPTTNVNAVEGANQIFNTRIEDFTRQSTLSGESDLVGIEDNPEFDMDFNPNTAEDNYI